MISRAVSAATVASLVFLVNAAAALAEDKGESKNSGGASDPTQIGENAKGIVEPNAKALWWICLVVGLLGMAASRKASRAGGIAIMLLVSGIAIYNPAGVGSAMSGVAARIF